MAKPMAKRTMHRIVAVATDRLRNLVPVIVVAALPSIAVAADRPDWAFPPAQQENVPEEHDNGMAKRVPGSALSFTQAQIDDRMNPPDWFPDEHPSLPRVVAHGNGTTVRACMGCHLATGHGHPENSRLPGTTASYLA